MNQTTKYLGSEFENTKMFKLQTAITHKVNGIPSSSTSYKLDQECKDRLFLQNLQQVTHLKTKSAASDYNDLDENFNYNPIVVPISDKALQMQQEQLKPAKQNSKTKQVQKIVSGGSDLYRNEDQDDLIQHEQQRNALKKQGVYRQMRVSLTKPQLISHLLDLFKQKNEYKFNELQVFLDHPVQPLKEALKDLADFDQKRKVYTLKNGLKFD